jgi:hypothetical protein
MKNTCKGFRRSLQKHEEHITTPNLPQPAPDTHLNDLQKQGFSANQERNSYQPYGIKLRNEVKFDIQPTNTQAVIVATGHCEYWITDVDFMKHQGNDTESPSDDPVLPEVYTATVACIYNVDGKCKGMLTPERFNILQRAFEKAECIGLNDNIHPPPHCLASELVGLVTHK